MRDTTVGYQLILEEDPSKGLSKDVGENVFLADLSNEYEVFVFYYPSVAAKPDLEGGLRNLGELAGKNIFVNIGKLDDPDLAGILAVFNVTKYPAVIVTATGDLAAPPHDYLNAFVRLDNDHLMADSQRAIRLVHEISTLFLKGEISEAAQKANWTQRKEGLRAVAQVFVEGLRKLAGFVAERDIKVSIIEGRLELTRREG